jgi:hypothetical protein
MRRNRRGGHGGLEFGGSGEDSFVAVVVTKLTGALLFILLLTMVIMALLPKAVDLPASDRSRPSGEPEAPSLAITTPEALPEAIAGHPYTLALAATGGRGVLKWSVAGPLPDGLSLDGPGGLIRGTPRAGTPKPAELVLRVSDGAETAARPARLVVYQSDRPLSTPSWWKPAMPPVPWKAWLGQGFGFLVLWLVHLVGMNAVAGLERWSLGAVTPDPAGAGEAGLSAVHRRFAVYRAAVRLTSLSAAMSLAVWLWWHHAGR